MTRYSVKQTNQQYTNNDIDIAYFIDTFYMYNAHIFKTAFYSINIIMKGFNKKNIKINEKPYKVDFCYLDANLSQFWQQLLSKGPSTSKLAKNIIDIYVYFFQNMISRFFFI